jgi:diguanylate cyclase (GGDEF)-like protein/PAS domain S-box-containing protein
MDESGALTTERDDARAYRDRPTLARMARHTWLRLGAERGPGGRRETAFAAAAVVGYIAAAYWARYISLPGSVLIWFPPAGVAVGALFLRPRLLPLLVLAEGFSTVVVMRLGPEFGPGALAVNSVGIVGAYAAAAWTMRRLSLSPRLRSSEDIFALVFSAVVVGASVAALVGVLVQVWVDLVEWGDATHAIGIFWIGDVVGIAAVTPAVLLAGHAFLDRAPFPLADHEHRHNRLVLLAEYIAPSLCAVVLLSVSDSPMRFVYLAFVPVVALSIRHGVPAAALSSAALAATMSAGAHVLVDNTLDRSDFQLLMVVLTLTGVATGAIVSARRDVADANKRISAIVEATPDLVATAWPDGRIRYLNPVGRQLLGVGDDQLDSSGAFDFMPDDLAADLMREGMRSARRFGTWSGENRVRRSDGTEVTVSQVLIAHEDPDDGSVTYSTVCRDMTAQRNLEDQLRRAALYDDATGLPNRALLAEQLSRVGDDEGHVSAILFADVDHLQRVNEAFGFAGGDQVVITLSERILTLVRAGDLVARYGGAQFVVVLPRVSDEFEAIPFANRLLDCFAEPVRIDGRDVKVTGSVGIAMARGTDPSDGLRSAEIALHRAKEAGGGRFALFDIDLEARAKQRMEAEADLREALATGSWWLAYQPVVDPLAGRIAAAEALLRWTHPARGPVSPFDLIRLAENTGAIVDLGHEIFRRACVEAQTWLQAGFDLRVSINVSARQLREPDFADRVAGLVRETGISPQQVSIELTETVLASDEHGEIDRLRDLRALGFVIALDDFGTGYSSLSGLRDLPIDMVKLDRSFVVDLMRSNRAAALVEAVVRLATSLDLTVVAEGVEDPEQVAALVDLGCHRIQGYAISYPLEPAQFRSLLDVDHGRIVVPGLTRT